MKKIFLLTMFIWLTFSVFAQRKSYENMNDLFRRNGSLAYRVAIDLGYGYGIGQSLQIVSGLAYLPQSYYNIQSKVGGVPHLNLEFYINTAWSVKFNGAYTNNSIYFLNESAPNGSSGISVYNYSLKNQVFRYSLLGNCHLIHARFNDFYMGIGGGITQYKQKWSTTDPKVEDGIWNNALVHQPNEFNALLRIGSRWWPRRNIGFYIEMGSGIDIGKQIDGVHDEINAGLCFRF